MRASVFFMMRTGLSPGSENATPRCQYSTPGADVKPPRGDFPGQTHDVLKTVFS